MTANPFAEMNAQLPAVSSAKQDSRLCIHELSLPSTTAQSDGIFVAADLRVGRFRFTTADSEVGRYDPGTTLRCRLSCVRLRWRLLPVLVAVGLVAGCVRRTVTINTDPQGAAVTLNDDEIGTSPVSVGFTWYGDYDVIIRKEGYETLQTHRRIERPWYQYPPIDLVAEAFVPFTFHDRREMFFELVPAEPIDRDALLENAFEFRDRALFGED